MCMPCFLSARKVIRFVPYIGGFDIILVFEFVFWHAKSEFLMFSQSFAVFYFLSMKLIRTGKVAYNIVYFKCGNYVTCLPAHHVHELCGPIIINNHRGGRAAKKSIRCCFFYIKPFWVTVLIFFTNGSYCTAIGSLIFITRTSFRVTVKNSHLCSQKSILHQKRVFIGNIQIKTNRRTLSVAKPYLVFRVSRCPNFH